MSGTYLTGANLSGANLSKTDLSGADLTRANLSGANLSGTYIVGVDLTGAIGLDAPKVAITESTSTLYVRITEQPLTARNLATATSALTQLHTQCWLIATDQFAELIEYTQTHNPSFDEEANLTIAEMTHHSPAEIIFNVSLEGVANALKTAIDAVTGMWERKRELELKNDALEEEIRQKKQEAEVTLASEEIAQQKALVELYDMQIEVRRKQLDLLDYATEKAPKVLESLRPDANATTKVMAANTLIKSLTQLGEAKGLELLPSLSDSEPPPQKSEEKTVTPENE